MSTNPSMTRFRLFCLLADAAKPMTIEAMVKKFGPQLNANDSRMILVNNQNHIIARPVGRGQFSYELKEPHQYRGAWKMGQM